MDNNGQNSVYETWLNNVKSTILIDGIKKTLDDKTINTLIDSHFDQSRIKSRLVGEDLLKILGINKDVLREVDLEAENIREVGLGYITGEIDGVKYVHHKHFENWGLTVKNYPVVMFYPKTKVDVQKIVKWAKNNGKRIRCSGYTHSWTPIYNDDNEVMICMIPNEQSQIPNAPPEPPVDGTLTEIKYLGFAPDDYQPEIKPGIGKKHLVKVGSSVTNEMLRVWGIKNNLTLPLNVIMEDITFGGSNGSISHGSGINQGNLGDIVYEIEIINSESDTVTYNQKEDGFEKFYSAVGALGLFGVTVSITFLMNEMTYIEVNTIKVDLDLIPRYRTGFDALGERDDKYLESVKKFESLIMNNYYNEFFWFPLQDKLVVNCWDNKSVKANDPEIRDFPLEKDVRSEKIKSYLMELVGDKVFNLLPLKTQTEIIGTIALSQFSDTKHKTYLYNGLHFQRGIHYWRVRNYELEIPLPESPDDKDKPDFKIIQRAWWDAIDYVRQMAENDDCPINVAMEMRIMKGSNVMMAPQKNNSWTLMIEILGNMNVPKNRWDGVAQEINDIWSAKYQDMKDFNFRLHWGKQFHMINMKGLNYLDYAKEYAYKNEIRIFNKYRSKADKTGMFSNKTYDYIFDIEHKPDVIRNNDQIDWKNTDNSFAKNLYKKVSNGIKRITGCFKGLCCFSDRLNLG
jgi:hypothetical protein